LLERDWKLGENVLTDIFMWAYDMLLCDSFPLGDQWMTAVNAGLQVFIELVDAGLQLFIELEDAGLQLFIELVNAGLQLFIELVDAGLQLFIELVRGRCWSSVVY